MNHLNAIFSTAQRLQASRSFLRDLRGLDKTAEGVEFAKAIREAAALGATPEDVVEQVVKAMAGNEVMALEVLGAVQEIAKAHIEQHTRTLANGKTVNVKAHETARTAAMKQTTLAHGATFHAMRTKTPEAHENAAAAHEAAAQQHGAAHEVHPMDVPEVGKEHANLKSQHLMSADYHRQEAASMRHGHGYEVQANKAATATQGTRAAITTHQSQVSHQKAAEEHQKAHEFRPDAGHGTTAEMHTSMARAAGAVNQASNSPHHGSDVKQAADASLSAYRASDKAHQAASPEAHRAAAKAHEAAINQHMEIHGSKESDEDGHHGQIAKTHMALHAYHSAKAKGETVAKAEVRPPGENPHAAPGAILSTEAGCLAGGGEGNPGNKQEPSVAKADGPMTITPTTTDLAAKTGGEALAVEGRPDEKDGEEIGKAHVEGHTRTQGGKVVQVQSYDTHHAAAMKASGEAHAATGKAQTPEQHTQTAAGHMKAAQQHREAAKYAPEDWQKKGHEDNAKLHEHYAQAHHAKAKAADQRADTGVDTPKHTPQDLKELENHSDYAGFGYLGDKNRSEETDQHLAEAANKAGLSKHELAAHVLSKSGRHMMDDHTNLSSRATPEEKVAHFQRHLTSPKSEKEYGIKAYAKDLEDRAPKKPEASKPSATAAPVNPPPAAEKVASGHHNEALAAARASGASRDNPNTRPGKSWKASVDAHAASEKAAKEQGPMDHKEAQEAHLRAQAAHAGEWGPGSQEHHRKAAEAHGKAAAAHKEAGEGTGPANTRPVPQETHHGKALAAAQAVTGRDKKTMLKYSEEAHKASEHAEKTGKPEDHKAAAISHMRAGMSHDQAREDSGYKNNGHQEAWMAHRAAEKYHRTKSGE